MLLSIYSKGLFGGRAYSDWCVSVLGRVQDELLDQIQGFGVDLRGLPARLHHVADVDVQVVEQLLGGA